MKTLILILISFNLSAQKADTTGVYQLLVNEGVKQPKIVFSQMMLESGYLNCKNCSWECCNNPFGFFYKGKYVEFCTLYEAIEYYHTWQSRLFKGGDYYQFLKRIGYATDPNYIERLKEVYKLIWG